MEKRNAGEDAGASFTLSYRQSHCLHLQVPQEHMLFWFSMVRLLSAMQTHAFRFHYTP